jgi:DNA-directed RNA polymerase alpha subunit
MDLTLTVSNADQARQAIDILQAFMRLQEPAPLRTPAPSETPIEALDLSVRACNCLRAEGIKTVEQLLYWSHKELSRVPNLGRRTLDEITAELAQRGMKLGTKHRRTFTQP